MITKRIPRLYHSLAIVLLGAIMIGYALNQLGQPDVDLSGFSARYLAVLAGGAAAVAAATLVHLLRLLSQLYSLVRRRGPAESAGLLVPKREHARQAAAAGVLALLLIGLQIRTHLASAEDPLTRGFLVFFLTWLILFSGINLAWLVDWSWLLEQCKQPSVKWPGLITLGLAGILAALDFSPFGFEKKSSVIQNFRLTGFPILDYQLFLSWLIVVAIALIAGWLLARSAGQKAISGRSLDFMIGAALFLAAFLIWRTAPILPNAFSDLPRPPNFQPYPNLDAQPYDRTALSLLTAGKLQTYITPGITQTVGRRPLFAVYLAGLHWISRSDYTAMIKIQVAFYALLPGLVYLFTREIHNRLSGILAAALIIVRNLNGVWLSDEIWGGTSLHMLMSDILAMMVAVLALYLAVRWIKGKDPGGWQPLIIGAVLGVGSLFRQELVVFLPVIALVAFLDRRARVGHLAGQLALGLAGLAVVVLPWMARNYLASGRIYLDAPGKISGRLAEMFQGPADKQTPVPEGEAPTSAASSPGSEPPRAGKDSLTTIADHVANSAPQMLLYLPSNPVVLEVDYIWSLLEGKIERNFDGVVYSPYAYAKTLDYWWYDHWNGRIAAKSWLPLLANLALISIGIYRVWKAQGRVVLVPLLSIPAMIGVYALIGSSGGRWLQTVDWISAAFLGIGLMHLTQGGLSRLGFPAALAALDGSSIEGGAAPVRRRGAWAGLALMLGLIALGSLPGLLEAWLDNPYGTIPPREKLAAVLENDPRVLSAGDESRLQELLDRGGEILFGQALYPRYFPPDAEMMTENETTFPSSLTLTISGSELAFVVLRHAQAVDWLPQGTDVLVLGCRESSFPEVPTFSCLGCWQREFEAYAVLLLDRAGALQDVLWRDGYQAGDLGCPLPTE